MTKKRLPDMNPLGRFGQIVLRGHCFTQRPENVCHQIRFGWLYEL
jgi:hypothetical protein